MIYPEINYVAVLIASLANFVAGFAWFSPKTMFPVWWRAMGKSPDDQPGTESMGTVFGLTIVGVFVQTFTIAVVIGWYGATNLGEINLVSGAMIGSFIGIGSAAAASLSHRLFGGHGLKVWLIEVGSDILNATLVGAVLGLLS
ncbi:MAG: hypothetical protein RLZZ330_268 [Actinomycetota bacterium]|jgi:hypothetical protein